MHYAYSSRPFVADDAPRGYVLASLCYPNVSLNQWKSHVRRLSTGITTRSGMMGIVDSRGYWHAIFGHRMERDLGSGSVLRVFDMIVGQVVGADILSLVMDAIDTLNREKGCQAVVIDITEWSTGWSDPACRRRFEQAGYRVNAISLTRQA